MFKKILVLILICFFVSSGYSQVVEEKTLGDLGYKNIVIENDSNVCYDITVPKMNGTSNSDFVFVIDIENYIPVNNHVKFSVFLNEYLEKTIEAKDIKKRNVVYLKNYDNNTNNLKLCVENNFLPRIIISKTSKIGYYLLAKIEQKDLYQIIPHTIKTNELTPIEIVFRNMGEDDVYVNVENTTDKYLINNLLNHVSGTHTYNGILRAKEQKSIKYFIKTKEDLLYISPRAKLTYVNEFGENIEITTEPVVINAEQQKENIDVFIDIKDEIYLKKETTGTIILRNKSTENIDDLYLTAISDELVTIKDVVNNLKVNEVVEIPFTIKPYNTKEVDVIFSITYNINEINFQQEASKTINVSAESSLYEFVGIFILLFIIIYVWFLKI
jgi:hypothetical protein